MKYLVLMAFLGVVACGPGETAPEPAPVKAPPKVEKKKPTLSPARAQYKKTYEELACRANIDFDPFDDMATIHEPVTMIRQLVELKDNRLKYYRRIIERNNYASVDEFLKKDEFLKDAVPVWWNGLRGGLPDLMKVCKEIRSRNRTK